MSVSDELDLQWASKEQGDAVFRFRAISQNAYMTLSETVAQLGELVASSHFEGVSAGILASGGAVLQIINDTKTSLDAHAAFLNWKQPIG